MPTLSGSILYNINNQAPTTGTGIPNIPIAIYDTSTNLGIVVLTDSSGNYVVNNVPAGNYSIVEAYGTSGGISSPADFSAATILGNILPKDPPITSVLAPSPIATDLESLSPNTLFITISTSNISGLNFIDGPIKNVPLTYSPAVSIGTNNLVTVADNGIFGTLPAGTAVNTVAPVAPYPSATTGFTYINSTPFDGSYSVWNTSNYYSIGVWWYTSDHTSRDETGRMMVVNGSNPGASLIQQTLTVTKNTYYMATLWIMNLIFVNGAVLPQMGFDVLDSNNNIIFNKTSANIPVDSIPSWYQLGTIFNSGENTTLTFNVYSNGAAAYGNDYLIDDLALNIVTPTNFLTISKTVDKEFISVPDTITYTLTLTNPINQVVSNFFFIDTIPTGTSFINNTLAINNSIVSGSPISQGTDLGPIDPFSVNTITFSVLAYTLPTSNYITNQATPTYIYSAITNGATVSNSILSNTVSTFVASDNVVISKNVDKTFSTLGDTVTYSISIKNNGNIPVLNGIFIDTIPNGMIFIPNSVYLNNSLVSGVSPSLGFNIGNIPIGGISTVTFQTVVNN